LFNRTGFPGTIRAYRPRRSGTDRRWIQVRVPGSLRQAQRANSNRSHQHRYSVGAVASPNLITDSNSRDITDSASWDIANSNSWDIAI
jgi:hypothetical protein